MNKLQLIATNDKPNTDEMKVIVAGMLDYHTSKGHDRKSEQFSILLKDTDNKVFGCVIVTFLWNGMEIDTLWVDESLRGKGWGRKLMEAAEAEGIRRGSALAYTNTFTWQAPDFYQHLGYRLYGQLDNFPKGNTLFYLQKSLI